VDPVWAPPPHYENKKNTFTYSDFVKCPRSNPNDLFRLHSYNLCMRRVVQTKQVIRQVQVYDHLDCDASYNYDDLQRKCVYGTKEENHICIGKARKDTQIIL
jgi:hypothetical protein